LQAGTSCKAARGCLQRVDDMPGRPDVRVAASEVGERLPALRRCGCDPRKERREVLLGETLETMRTRAHARRC
jgi:hypothetical protein